MPEVRPRGDPPGGTQARRRGEHPLGGDQRGAEAGLRHARVDSALRLRSRGPVPGDLRRRVPLGLRRHRAGDLRLRPRRGGHRLLRHPGADHALGPRLLRDQGRDQARRLRRDRAAGGLRRQEPEDDRQARRRRVGPERDQGLHHQRWHRRRPRRRRHRRPGARHPRPGLVRRSQGHPGALPGQEGVEARDPRLAYRRDRAGGLPRPRRLSARRRREAGEEAAARAAKAKSPAAPTRWRPSR